MNEELTREILQELLNEQTGELERITDRKVTGLINALLFGSLIVAVIFGLIALITFVLGMFDGMQWFFLFAITVFILSLTQMLVLLLAKRHTLSL